MAELGTNPALLDAARGEVIDGVKKVPDLAKSLEENGLRHKSLVRFWTPGFSGYKSSAS